VKNKRVLILAQTQQACTKAAIYTATMPNTLDAPLPAPLPVLYSFRRCPYAMRARLALHVSGVAYEHREVVLKHKPAHMLALSPKGTVPVLGLLGEAAPRVLEQSLDIMRWALDQCDPLAWWPATALDLADSMALIAHNDGPFKGQLDRYKYPNRSGLDSGEADRDEAAIWLRTLDARLRAQAFLAGEHFGLADAAVAPFVRQYAHTDPNWFAAQAWPSLIAWLAAFEGSALFAAIMVKHAPWPEPAPVL
jgi:glutathione S-transferase